MASIRVRRRRIVLPAVAVVLLVFAVSFCRSGSVGHMPSTEEEARDYHEMKSKVAAKEEKEKDQSSETWTEWAKEKISGGLGLKNEHHEDGVKKVTDFTSDNAKKAKDKIENVASEAGQYGAEKAREVKDTATEKAAEAKEKAAEMAESARGTAAEKTTEAVEKAKEGAYNAAKAAKEKAKEAKERAEEEGERAEEATEKRKSWAKEGFEAVKGKAEEAVEAAKEKIGEQYEAAKKKSQRIKDDVARSEAEIGVDDEL